MESGRERGWTRKIYGHRWGFEHSPIVHSGRPYMTRWILYIAGYTLRLHKFYTGDERGPQGLHNHPFWFITFPLTSYREEIAISPDQHPAIPQWLRDRRPYGGWITGVRTVRAFRFHFRGVDFRHRVLALDKAPAWTIVISGRYQQKWGFFPTPDTFQPYEHRTPKP